MQRGSPVDPLGWAWASFPVMRGRVVAMVAIASGLVAAAPASAGPPRTATIVSVASTNRHLTATWTLPPGVESDHIEVATSPATGSNGRFFGENLEDYDILEPEQTSYVATHQLDPGTYYVHVGTLDNSCSYLENNSCYAESPAAQVVITLPANVLPTLGFVRWARETGDALMRACDETKAGMLTFRTKLTRTGLGRRPATKRRSWRWDTPTYLEGERMCSTYYVPLPALYGVGRYAMTMTVTDSRGGTSKPFVRRWVTRD
jgi:hypothetical protein